MTKRLSSRLQRGSLKRDLHRHRNGEHGVARPSSTGHAMVGLGCVEQTLLIPLAARALARRLFPSQGFADRTAEAVAARLDYDLTRFEADREMLRGLVERSLVLDDLLCRFLKRHPEAHVLIPSRSLVDSWGGFSGGPRYDSRWRSPVWRSPWPLPSRSDLTLMPPNS